MSSFSEIVIYVGGLEAEDRARRERVLGFDTGYVDAGVNPHDYHGWKLEGASIICRVIEDCPALRLRQLVSVLHREGAVSVLVFDREGRYLYRATPFDGEYLREWLEVAA